MSPNDEKDDWDAVLFVPVLQLLQRVLPGFDVALGHSQILTIRSGTSGPPVVERDIGGLLAQLAQAQHHPRRSEALMAQLADDLCRTLRPHKLAPEQPFPILRPAAFTSAYGDEALIGSGIGDCKAVLMRQRPGGPPEVLTRGLAEDAGLSPDMLWAAAQRNLRALSTTLVLQEYDYGVMSIEVEGHDWLGGSLLLSETVLRKAMERLDIQAALICAPSQISVDLIDARTPDALARIEQWMGERLAEERPLSELVFAFDSAENGLIPSYASRGGRLIGPV